MKMLVSAMLKPLGEESKYFFIEQEDEQEESREVPDVEYPTISQGKPTFQQPDCNRTTNSEVTLQLNDSLKLRRVKEMTVGPGGKIEVHSNYNHALKSIS